MTKPKKIKTKKVRTHKSSPLKNVKIPTKEAETESRFYDSLKFTKFYLAFAGLVLLSTTLFWSVLSAKLQLGNADQLVNTYLLENSQTFHEASYTGSHSFLIKWPIFLLIKLFGESGNAFIVFTVILVLATVGGLAYILYRIDKRPLVFGTMILALASVLLLIPAQPYPGGLLPVNMAMITTRNLEYIVYIVCLIEIIRSARQRSVRFWSSTVLMSLLIASDKLFMTLSIGGAAIALIVYALVNRWSLVVLSVKWLVASIASMIIAIIILTLLNNTGVTHIAFQSSAGPFGLVHSFKDLVLGVAYSLLALFTNFGANPVYDTTILRNLPHQLWLHLQTISMIAFIINAALLVAALYMMGKITKTTLASKQESSDSLSLPIKLSLMLVFTTLAAFTAYVFSDHYFAADARYLSIVIFSLFIASSTYLSAKRLRSSRIIICGLLISIGIILAIPSVMDSYHAQSRAIAGDQARNSTISQILSIHKTDVLVGDYWRVIPTKLTTNKQLNVMPLSGCTEAQAILSSKTWQPDLRRHSFAYLLALDGNLTNFPDDCTLQQVINGYGRPNASALVSGTLKQPKEVLLFYDHGINQSSTTSKNLVAKPPSTVLPISLDELPNTSCAGPSIMNIVAHEDDDLLFTNPNLVNNIKAGYCIRTVYITAGDAGSDQFYWLNREKGSQAAYSEMIGSSAVWVQRIVRLSNHSYITVDNPRGNTKISLIFMHLPDGNVGGQGFSSSHNQSLQKLKSGKISRIESVDKQSYYSSTDLVNALASLMSTYKPTTIRTQATRNLSDAYPDHSDHITTGQYTKQAYDNFEIQQFANEVTIPIEYYIGYPIHDKPENVSGLNLQLKETIFLKYAQDDPGVCQTVDSCTQSPVYDVYLRRQYLDNQK